MRQQNALRHVVLFVLHPDADETVRSKISTLLTALGQHTAGLIEWTITESLDTRKGRVIIENALFENQEAFHRFLKSKEHAQAGAYLTNVADWVIGDYLDPVRQ